MKIVCKNTIYIYSWENAAKNRVLPSYIPRMRGEVILSSLCESVGESENVTLLQLSELHPFPNQPFKVRDDDAMKEMLESVIEYGVLTPGYCASS